MWWINIKFPDQLHHNWPCFIWFWIDLMKRIWPITRVLPFIVLIKISFGSMSFYWSFFMNTILGNLLSMFDKQHFRKPLCVKPSKYSISVQNSTNNILENNYVWSVPNIALLYRIHILPLSFSNEYDCKVPSEFNEIVSQ